MSDDTESANHDADVGLLADEIAMIAILLFIALSTMALLAFVIGLGTEGAYGLLRAA